MPHKLSRNGLDSLLLIYRAGVRGWSYPRRPPVHRNLGAGLPPTLKSLVLRGLVHEPERGLFLVRDSASVERELWDGGLVAVDAGFLREALCFVGEEMPMETIEGWTLEKRRNIWRWASAEHFAASDNGRRLPRPALLGERGHHVR